MRYILTVLLDEEQNLAKLDIYEMSNEGIIDHTHDEENNADVLSGIKNQIMDFKREILIEQAKENNNEM